MLCARDCLKSGDDADKKKDGEGSDEETTTDDNGDVIMMNEGEESHLTGWTKKNSSNRSSSRSNNSRNVAQSSFRPQSPPHDVVEDMNEATTRLSHTPTTRKRSPAQKQKSRASLAPGGATDPLSQLANDRILMEGRHEAAAGAAAKASYYNNF